MTTTTDTELIGVREAARILQVHENTIRNWVREGRLLDARVPGTRSLRLSRAQVEQLASAPDPSMVLVAPDVEAAWRRGYNAGLDEAVREMHQLIKQLKVKETP